MLQDTLSTVVRDSARAMLDRGGADFRYWPEAWFFAGLAISIFAWCLRTAGEDD